MKIFTIVAIAITSGGAQAQLLNGNFEANPFKANWNDGGTTVHSGTGEPGTGPGGGAGTAACFGVPGVPPGSTLSSDAFDCSANGTGPICKVTFSYWCEPNAQLTVKIAPNAGGAAGASFSPVPAQRDSRWRHATIFGDCSDANVITIEGTGGSGDEVCVDNFVATCVPEPGAFVALGLGLAALLFRSRR